MDVAAKVFWLTTLVAVPLALLVQSGAARWTAIGWLGLVGVTCAFANWATAVRYVARRRSGSMVPLLGVLCLGIAAAATPSKLLGRWRLLGTLLDPWPVIIAVWPFVCLFKERSREK